MKLLVTGANGFVGRALVPALLGQGHRIVAIEGRTGAQRRANGVEFHSADLTARPVLAPLLDGVDAVVHLAGKAHSREPATADAYASYRSVNNEAVAHLADQAARAGVKRFVLLSTIHVNGRSTDDAPFTEASAPRPAGPYELSKYEGEQRLIAAADGGMEWCVVRSPLIVGSNSKANLARLLLLVRSGLPLPFRVLRNRRSIVGLANLCAFLETCVAHPEAADQLFLIADEPALSTGQLVSLVAAALGQPLRQFSVPRLAWTLLNAVPPIRRRLGPLWESLEIDCEKARRLLHWRQRNTTASAIGEAVGYLE